MNIFSKQVLTASAVVLLITVGTFAKGVDKRARLGIAEVKIAPMLIKSVKSSGGKKKIMSMGRVVEAIDGKLTNRLHSTRKFRVMARSDLDAIFKEQDFSRSGNVDDNQGKATESFKISNIDYLVVTTLDDFQDFVETATFAGTGEKATKRVIRLGIVTKIWNTTSGELLESVSLALGPDDPDYKKLRDISKVRSYTKTDGDLSDRLLARAAYIMAERVAHRVVDVLYPAKVIGKRGNQIFINHGDGTWIKAGEIWNVFALGDEMVDPDTGVSLGSEEVQIGQVKITTVGPKFSRADILEDRGITKLQIVRPTAKN